MASPTTRTGDEPGGQFQELTMRWRLAICAENRLSIGTVDRHTLHLMGRAYLVSLPYHPVRACTPCTQPPLCS